MNSSLEPLPLGEGHDTDTDVVIMRRRKQAAYDTQPAAAAYRHAMNALTLVLLIATCVGASRLVREEALIAITLSMLFAVLYVLAVYRPSDRLWLKLVWVLILTVVWICILPVLEVGVYLLFPLFFLYLRVMPDYRGIIAVLGATLVAILNYRTHLTYGAVMGPGVSALVVIGIH